MSTASVEVSGVYKYDTKRLYFTHLEQDTQKLEAPVEALDQISSYTEARNRLPGYVQLFPRIPKGHALTSALLIPFVDD